MLQSWHLLRAARALAAGGVIAYPTEGVFGLGCDPWNPSAVRRLLRLKRRRVSMGLIVIAADEGALSEFIYYPDPAVRERVTRTWPGPVTWVLPCLTGTPLWLTGGRRTLAVRVVGVPIARALCGAVGPLVSTSANPSGCVPARDPHRVRAYFGNGVDLILPGRPGGEGGVTEIREGLSGVVLRAAGGHMTRMEAASRGGTEKPSAY